MINNELYNLAFIVNELKEITAQLLYRLVYDHMQPNQNSVDVVDNYRERAQIFTKVTDL